MEGQNRVSQALTKRWFATHSWNGLLVAALGMTFLLGRPVAAQPVLGPVFSEYGLTLEAGRRTEVLGPIFYHEDREEISQWAIPPLTTIRQPLSDMAAAATDMIVTLSQGEPLTQHRLMLATDLVVRASTAALRG